MTRGNDAPTLSKIARFEVEQFISLHEAHVASRGKDAAKLSQCISNAALKHVKMLHRQAVASGLAVPNPTGEDDDENREAEPVSESFKRFMTGKKKAERALKRLLRLVAAPPSKVQATDEIADEKLALRKGRLSWGDASLAQEMDRFEAAAAGARQHGTPEKSIVKAFETNFLRSYPSISRQVRAEVPETLEQAMDAFAVATTELDAAIRRVRNFQEDVGDGKCVSCGHNKSSLGKRNKETEVPSTPTKKTKGGAPSTTPTASVPTTPNKTAATPATKGQRTAFECLGCGKGLGADGKPECSFYSCKEGPWSVDETFRIRHVADSAKTPHQLHVPPKPRGSFPPGFAPKEPNDE